MQNTNFQNQDCIVIENEKIQLIVSRSIGPRILGINLRGRKNLLAELPDFTTQVPNGKPYHFFGGHRLWMAPENIPLTYEYDDQPVKIIAEDGSILIKKAIEKNSGMEKAIRLKLDPDEALVSVEHELKNWNNKPIECAPWAITQFRTGGVAILPQSKMDTGLLPNRLLVFWPYTDLNDPNVLWGNDYILLNAKVDSPFKIGFPNPKGWLAYWLDECLFVKRAAFSDGSTYYDMGSSSECYCNDQFLELETLGPKTFLEPGESVTHVETWRLFENVVRPENEADARSIVDCFELEDKA
ncbi:MAG: hypothetical protein CVU41_05980 [Chloroflexi bacterium HGW-Chloroflexi-3]|nr:MAG: hypothetical protein CVU41_05980 [Chloroflexi bacterium HGW-Chloroflexi-3]